jgi:hypothetical protein
MSFDIYFDETPELKTHVNENNNQSLTLVTIGDSFTWGDELGQAQHHLGIDDLEHRERHMFGRLLQQKLNSNFVQSAMPGVGNSWMLQECNKLLSRLTPITDQIVVVITFSELARELHNVADVATNPVNQIYIDAVRAEQPLQKTFEQVEQYYWRQLARVQERYPKATILASFGFTHPVTSCDFLTAQTWPDVVYQHFGIDNYTKSSMLYLGCRCFGNVIDYCNASAKVKQEFIDYTAITEQSRNQMKATGAYGPTHHPLELAHQLWADYLYEEINNALGSSNKSRNNT